jgi:hypothetical protein
MGMLGKGRAHVCHFFGKSLTWLIGLIRNFTGKVDEGIHAERRYFEAEHVGREGEVAARLIGNGKGMKEPKPGTLFCESQDLILRFPLLSFSED